MKVPLLQEPAAEADADWEVEDAERSSDHLDSQCEGRATSSAVSAAPPSRETYTMTKSDPRAPFPPQDRAAEACGTEGRPYRIVLFMFLRGSK